MIPFWQQQVPEHILTLRLNHQKNCKKKIAHRIFFASMVRSAQLVLPTFHQKPQPVEKPRSFHPTQHPVENSQRSRYQRLNLPTTQPLWLVPPGTNGAWRLQNVPSQTIFVGKLLLGLKIHLDVSENKGNPQIIHLNGVFHSKPSILGYPYFWKHPSWDVLKKKNSKFFGGSKLQETSLYVGQICSQSLHDFNFEMIEISRTAWNLWLTAF